MGAVDQLPRGPSNQGEQADLVEAEGEEADWSLAVWPHPEVVSHSWAGILSLSVLWNVWASLRPLHPSQQDVFKCTKYNTEDYRENQLY